MLDYGKYISVADKLQHKAIYQDRDDLNHTIILSLARAQERLDNDGGGHLSDVAMLRIGTYECQKYWRQQKRLLTILSLNSDIYDGDGNTTELIETLADDKAIDLEAWLTEATWRLGYPQRLVAIACKRVRGIPLTVADRKYLWKWRKKEQKTLIKG